MANHIMPWHHYRCWCGVPHCVGCVLQWWYVEGNLGPNAIQVCSCLRRWSKKCWICCERHGLLHASGKSKSSRGHKKNAQRESCVFWAHCCTVNRKRRKRRRGLRWWFCGSDIKKINLNSFETTPFSLCHRIRLIIQVRAYTVYTYMCTVDTTQVSSSTSVPCTAVEEVLYTSENVILQKIRF